MKKLIEKLLNAAKKYNVWDYGWLKICLFSLGIIFGVYFKEFFASYLPIICIIFIASYIWLMYKTFAKYLK